MSQISVEVIRMKGQDRKGQDRLLVVSGDDAHDCYRIRELEKEKENASLLEIAIRSLKR